MNTNKSNTKKDIQMKKVQLTINNPLDFDMSHDTILIHILILQENSLHMEMIL